MAQPPVIFLALAPQLRATDDEPYSQSISHALAPIVAAGMCELHTVPDCDISTISLIFRQPHLIGRIRAFHYIGPKDNIPVLFTPTSDLGEDQSNLPGILSQQPGLQFVYIHNCTNGTYLNMLNEGGIPVVIGTNPQLSPGIQRHLAAQFYQNLAQGFSLSRSWQESRTLIEHEYKKASSISPGVFLNRPGMQRSAYWSVPEAAGQPLKGLEAPSSLKGGDPQFLPLSLQPYEEDGAPTFLGRETYIKQLHEALLDASGPGVICLYGDNGVGKSSLLKAGVLPLLDIFSTTIYHPCFAGEPLNNQLKEAVTQLAPEGRPAVPESNSHNDLNKIEALAKVMEEGLQKELELFIEHQKAKAALNAFKEFQIVHTQTPDPDSLLYKWLRTETLLKRPISIVLDQVEHLFSEEKTPNPLATILGELGSSGLKPRGKLFLIYDGAQHTHIQDVLLAKGIEQVSFFLPPLKVNDIQEIFTRLRQRGYIPSEYHWVTEKEPLTRLSHQLAKLPAGEVAPSLQLLLNEIYQQPSNNNPEILRQHEPGLTSFVKEQFQELGLWKKGLVESGLILDILYRHALHQPTGGLDKEVLTKMYAHSNHSLYPILDKCVELQLLRRRDEETTLLAHDALIPVVSTLWHQSDRPGPRAYRLLTQDQTQVKLSDEESLLLEQGRLAMPVLQDESAVTRLQAAEVKVKAAKNRRKQLTIMTIAAAAALLVLAIIGSYQWIRSSQQSRLSDSEILSKEAQLALHKEKDPVKAFRLAQQAWIKNEENHEALDLMYRSYYPPISQYKERHHATPVYRAFDSPKTYLDPNGKYLLLSIQETMKLTETDGKVVQNLNIATEDVRSASFSRDGTLIFVEVPNEIKVFGVGNSTVYQNAIPARTPKELPVFSPDNQFILVPFDNYVWVWDFTSNKNMEIPGTLLHSRGSAANFSGNGEYVSTFTDSTFHVAHLPTGKVVANRNLPIRNPQHGLVSPDGRLVAAFNTDSIALWFWKSGSLTRFQTPAPVYEMDFSPDSKFIVAGSERGSAMSFSLGGDLIFEVRPYYQSRSRTRAYFVDNERLILSTDSENKTGIFGEITRNNQREWQMLAELEGVFVQFSHDDQYIITRNAASTCIHNLDGEKIYELIGKPSGISTNGNFLITREDNLSRLWNLTSNPIRVINYPPRTMEVPERLALRNQLNPDDKYLLRVQDTFATIRNLYTDETHRLSTSGDSILYGGFFPNGEACHLVSRRAVHFFDIYGRKINSLEVSPEYLWYAPDGDILLTASRNQVGLWRLNDGKKFTLPPLVDTITSATFSADGNKFAVVTEESVSIWGSDLQLKASLPDTIYKPLTGLKYATFHPEQDVLFLCAADSLYAWDWQNLRLASIKRYPGSAHSLVFAPDGRYTLTTREDARIWVHDAQWRPVTELIPPVDPILPSHTYHLRFSPDGSSFLSYTRQQTPQGGSEILQTLWLFKPEALIRRMTNLGAEKWQ